MERHFVSRTLLIGRQMGQTRCAGIMYKPSAHLVPALVSFARLIQAIGVLNDQSWYGVWPYSCERAAGIDNTYS